MVAQRRSSHRKLDFGRGLGYGMQDQAYTCGLLHDLGKVAKCKFDQKLFARDLKSTWDQKMDCHQWETTGKRIRHDLLGSYLARAWGISSWSRQLRNGTMRRTGPNATTSKMPQSKSWWTLSTLPTAPFTDLEFGNSGHRFKQELFQADFAQVAHGGRGLPEFRE